jgi:hypothetical protein
MQLWRLAAELLKPRWAQPAIGAALAHPAQKRLHAHRAAWCDDPLGRQG